MGGTTPFSSSNTNKIKSISVYASSKLQSEIQAATYAIAEQFSNDHDVNAQQTTAVDSYAGPNGVVRCEIKLAPSNVVIPDAQSVRSSNVVMIEEDLLHSLGVVAVQSLKESGTL